MPLPYNKDHRNRARRLRKHMTAAERSLWNKLRRKQLLGAQFYRQKPIDQYIVDFYCPRAHLVIELDGGQHFEPDHAEADRERDRALAQLGLKVLRFSNLEIGKHLDAVVEQIRAILADRLVEPSKGEERIPF